MEVRVNPCTAGPLQNDGTIRCLLRTTYTQNDRDSVTAIPWAKAKATEVSRSLLQSAGLGAETATFTVELNGSELYERPDHSYICYDVFLERCCREARDRIEGSTRQPIHVITNMANNVFIVRRAPDCDNRVALFLEKEFRDRKNLDQALKETAMNSIVDNAQNKLGIIIQDAAGEITRYIGGAYGEHIIDQLDLQLYITKVMISGSEENFNDVTVKKIDPVADKDARFAVANVVAFLLRSFRAQKESDKFKSALEHSAEKLEEEIKAKKNAENGASEDGRNGIEEGRSRMDS